MDWIPGISQGKSFFQWVSGDSEGARETQERFSKQCPGISQARSAVHALCGDDKQAAEVQMEQAKLLENIVSSVPGAGHIAGGIAFACGDNERGCQYMKNASRSTAVVGGALAAGPVGALAAGAAYDAVQYGIEMGVHGKADLGGAPGIIKNMVECTDERKQGGNTFDLAACIVGDMALGKAGSQAVKNCANTMKSIASGSAPPAPGIPPSGPSVPGPSGGVPPGVVTKTPGLGGTPTALAGVPKLPSVSSALKNSAQMHMAAPTEANRTGSCPPNPQMEAQSQSSTSPTGETQGNDGGNPAHNPQGPNPDQGGGERGGTQRGTDSPAPTDNPVETNTEEEPPRDEERGFINVHDTNEDAIWEAMATRIPTTKHYDTLFAMQHMKMAMRELVRLAHLFVNERARPGPDPRLFPDDEGEERDFVSPFSLSEAKCRLVDSEYGRFVCVTRRGASSNTFCSMTSDKLSVTAGFSIGARRAYAESLEVGNPSARLWIGDGGELLDSMALPTVGHPSLRASQGRDAHPDLDLPDDQCAEHHAAVLLCENGETPVSSVAFRMDQHRRIFSVPRCDKCKPYNLGVVLTDFLPMGTWLNPPRKFNVYTDTQ